MQTKVGRLGGKQAPSTTPPIGQPLGSHLKGAPGKVKFSKFRTDNCVKNHFYSFFRKCIKNVNYSLNVLSERKIRPLKLSIMNKIVSIIEAHHKDPHNFDMTVYKDARGIKFEI